MSRNVPSLCGVDEKEIAEMFKTAFLNSKVVNNDVNEAAEYLEKGKERNKAMEIPADVRLNIPKAKPSGPKVVPVSIAPWISKWPKEVIGIRAPAPAYKTIRS